MVSYAEIAPFYNVLPAIFQICQNGVHFPAANDNKMAPFSYYLLKRYHFSLVGTIIVFYFIFINFCDLRKCF